MASEQDPVQVEKQIEVELITSWAREELVELYRAGGWWTEGWDLSGVDALIRGSFAFAVAIDRADNRAIGMGRVLSDGVSDAFIEDVVVLPSYRGMGVGTMILSALLKHCTAAGITWIVLIAEPGIEDFYVPLGFQRLEGYIPMRYRGDDMNAHDR